MTKPALVDALALALALGVALAPASARANAFDTFGASSRIEALAGAGAAEATGWAAAHHNPAGVAFADEVEAAVGYGYGVPRLTIDGADAQVTTPRGTSLGLSVPVELGWARVSFGLALYLPDQFLARIQTIPVEEPHFVLLDNNIDHIVVTPVLALRPFRWLSIGGGATLLADAAGHGITFDVGLSGGQKVGQAGLDVSLPIRAAPVLGLLVAPKKWLRLALAWRGQVDLALSLDILARVNVVGAVTGDTLISLRAFNFFTPQKLSLGAAWDISDAWTVTAELDWVNWSGFRGGSADLRILVELGVSPSLVQALFPADRFRDTWVPRLGVEWRRPFGRRFTAAARAGYAYERSPVPDQTGLTSFADGDQHVIALGGGLQVAHLGDVLEHPLSLDLALGWHELEPRTTVKDPRLFPSAGFTAGGRIVHLSLTLAARF
jgi:hypothetical protein